MSTHLSNQRDLGTVCRKGEHFLIIVDAYGDEYFAYRASLDSFGPKIDQIMIGQQVTFTAATGDRGNMRAVDVRVVR